MINLRKIEFAVTYACTGKCKHCSEGAHPLDGARIDPAIAADAVRRVSERYDIETVMAFGGEPLLHAEAVYAIMEAAKERNIPRRQVITNGFFSRERENMRAVAERLSRSGVNDLLLSVDAFHQETIPLATVKIFAEEAKKCAIPMRLQPAWLLSREDENPYNLETRKILESFRALEIPVGEGNLIFPEGNAKIYLSEYFKNGAPINPYIEDPRDIRCLSFSPNGDVLGRNIYKNDILWIIEHYDPEAFCEAENEEA